MNLFNGFYRITKVQQAKIELEKAKNNELQISESLSLAHKVALSNYLTAYHTLKQKSESSNWYYLQSKDGWWETVGHFHE